MVFIPTKEEEEKNVGRKTDSPIFKQFMSFFKTKKVKKKEFLLKEGEINDEIFYVKKGILRLYLIYEGREINTWFVKEDEFIIAVKSFYHSSPSQEFIQAVEDCEILTIKKNTYELLIKSNHKFALYAIDELFLKLCEFQDQAQSLRFMNAEKKYEFLITLKKNIVSRLSQKHIASFLGIENTYLSKIVSNYKNEN
jgi:CRP-like cAMP-binding protein